MTSIPSPFSLILDFPPSCVAFVPTQPQYFVVGTYFLHPKDEQHSGDKADKEAQRRSGSLILYKLVNDKM
jgi:diphthine methyl ester acylhydrolase